MSKQTNAPSERDELAQIIDDRWHGYGYNPQGAAEAILAAGYRKPRKVKGDSPLGRIRELFKQLDHWERDGHTTAGIAYLRRHFKDVR